MRLRHAVLSSLAAAVLTLAHGRADAQTSPPTFDAVTAYTASSNTFTVVGVQHGASASSTMSFSFGAQQSVAAQSCEKQLLIMLNRPGRFSITILVNALNASCTLTQTP
jgi:hypothetical protein